MVSCKQELDTVQKYLHHDEDIIERVPINASAAVLTVTEKLLINLY